MPNTWPVCNHNSFRIKEKKSYDIQNPYYGSCTRKSCGAKKSLRNYSFFKLYSHIPCSVILKIFDLYIISKLNAKPIHTTLYEKIIISLLNKWFIIIFIAVTNFYFLSFYFYYNKRISKNLLFSLLSIDIFWFKRFILKYKLYK